MTDLYICVDESGNHSRDECYVVAGCWFVSERANPQSALAPTKDQLLSKRQTIRDEQTQAGELKGQSIRPPLLGDLIDYLRSTMYDDSTISTSAVPWQMSIPIGFTLAVIQSEWFRESVSDYDGRLSRLELMQVTALTSILAPLTGNRSLLSLNDVDAIRVLPDASTWDTASRHFERRLELPGVNFETRDSRKTPGIQIADLAAYAWRRNTLHGDCGAATGLLHDLRFAR